MDGVRYRRSGGDLGRVPDGGIDGQRQASSGPENWTKPTVCGFPKLLVLLRLRSFAVYNPRKRIGAAYTDGLSSNRRRRIIRFGPVSFDSFR